MLCGAMFRHGGGTGALLRRGSRRLVPQHTLSGHGHAMVFALRHHSSATSDGADGGGGGGQAASFAYTRATVASEAKEAGGAHSASSSGTSSSAAAAESSHTAEGAEGTPKGYNPWAVLGLKPGASMHDVRQRYHELLKECHPNFIEKGADPDIVRVNAVNKAYETITKAPTLDKRYRGLVSDTQYVYYKYLPEWMARNVDEMPRYYTWIRWRVSDAVFVAFILATCYTFGRYYNDYPERVTLIAIAFFADVLLHTYLLPSAIFFLAVETIFSGQERSLAWLTSPRTFLQRELLY